MNKKSKTWRIGWFLGNPRTGDLRIYHKKYIKEIALKEDSLIQYWEILSCPMFKVIRKENLIDVS